MLQTTRWSREDADFISFPDLPAMLGIFRIRKEFARRRQAQPAPQEGRNRHCRLGMAAKDKLYPVDLPLRSRSLTGRIRLPATRMQPCPPNLVGPDRQPVNLHQTGQGQHPAVG